MKASTKKLLATLNSGGKVSNRVHQGTINHAVINGWIEFDSSIGWKITDKGYLAYVRA